MTTTKRLHPPTITEQPTNRCTDPTCPHLAPDRPREAPLRHTHRCGFPSGEADPPDIGLNADREPAPLLVTVPEAARLLSLGRTKVYELMATDELEEVHIGRAARVPVGAVRWSRSPTSSAIPTHECC